MQTPSNIYLIGLMGAGKTTVGKALAKQLDRQFLDADAEIARVAGKSIAKIFSEDGEGIFRHMEGRVIRALSARTNLVAALGGGAVTRPINLTRLKVSGLMIWLDFPVHVLVQRLTDNSDRPLLLQSRTDEEKSAALARLLKERKPLYQQADIHLKYQEETAVHDMIRKIISKL